MRVTSETHPGSCFNRNGIVSWDGTGMQAVTCLPYAAIWDTISIVSWKPSEKTSDY